MMPAGIGLATLRACIKLNFGISAQNSGIYSAGNGPAMRAAILGAAVDDVEKLRELVTASTRITHTDPRAEIGALAVALAARAARAQLEIDPAEFIAGLQQLCPQAEASELCDDLKKAADSIASDETTEVFARSIGLSRGVTGYINDTVTIVLHGWWTYPMDFRSAVRSVVACGGDSDTTAAILGGIVGAAVGKEGIPVEWIDGICEWPQSIQRMQDIAAQLARVCVTGVPESPMRLLWPGVAARNALFAAAVLCHGLRRLLPPY